MASRRIQVLSVSVAMALFAGCSSSESTPQQVVAPGGGANAGGAANVAGSTGVSGSASATAGSVAAAGSGDFAGAAGMGGVTNAGGAAGSAGTAGSAAGQAGVGGTLNAAGASGAGAAAGSSGASGAGGAMGAGGASIAAGGVSGGTGPNLALNKPATASSVEQGDHAAIRINDGDEVTRWVGVMAIYPQWNQIDLGASYSIDTIAVLPYMSRAYQFVLEGSLDGITYFPLADETINTAGGIALTVTFSPQTTQYVRITISGASGYDLGWSAINELQVFEAQ